MYMKNIALSALLLAFIGISPVLSQGDSLVRPEERKENKQLTTLDASAVACIKSAVIKREDALIAGFDIYAASIKSARQLRKDALSVAWDKTVSSERRAAVKAADKAFSDSSRSARKTWNETRRGAWSTFTADRKACNVSGISAVDTGSPSTDASL